MNHGQWLAVFTFMRKYLGDNEESLVLKSSFFFFSAWFHLVDSLVLVGWVFPALQSLVRQHFIEKSLFVTVKDIEGNVS